MIGFIAFRSATAVLSDVSNDRKWGILAIFGLYGGSVGSYLLSIVLFAGVVFLAQVLVVAGVAAMLFDPSDLFEQFWTISAIGLMLSLGWIGIGVAVGARVDSYARRDFLVTLSALPMVLSAPIFFPLEDANAFVRGVSLANPLSYQVSWLRDADGLGSFEVLQAMLWSTAGLAVGYVFLRGADRLSVER
jgi:ABC-2 type transport system permease protein